MKITNELNSNTDFLSLSNKEEELGWQAWLAWMRWPGWGGWPGFFFFIGGRPSDVPAKMAIPNHSPFFYVDEGALPLGVHAMSRLAMDYLRAGAQ